MEERTARAQAKLEDLITLKRGKGQTVEIEEPIYSTRAGWYLRCKLNVNGKIVRYWFGGNRWHQS